MMMLRRMPALFLAGSLALAIGCDDGGGDDDTGGESGGADRSATILGLEGDAAAGGTLFTSSGCSNDACHGADGMSGMASPALNTSVPNADDAQIVSTLLNGKGSMPPQSSLADQQLADLLAYVSDTFGG